MRILTKATMKSVKELMCASPNPCHQDVPSQLFPGYQQIPIAQSRTTNATNKQTQYKVRPTASTSKTMKMLKYRNTITSNLIRAVEPLNTMYKTPK